MQIKAKHSIRFFSALCLFASADVFAQTFYVQLSFGNNYYSNPQTSFEKFAPSADLSLMYSSKYDPAKTVNIFGAVNLKYNYATQYYKAGPLYTAHENEGIFGIGAVIEMKKGIQYVLFPICLNVGNTYANSNQPYITNSAQLGFTGQKDNIHSFIQFYLSGGVQYGFQLSKRISVLAGIKAFLYLFEDDIGALGMQGTNILFNYAPLKFYPSLGMQVEF